MSNYHRYTELEVWKQGRELATNIYELTASYPKYEQFGLTSQMRRSVVSVPSNIAEGCGRQHKKETMYFLSISRGSLFELETRYISQKI
jgi:four helix bundle protein